MAAFVIPAFEYVKYEEGRDFRVFPQTKKVYIHRILFARAEHE